MVREAQARHLTRGEDLSGYTARTVTRSEGTIGATRWAPDFTAVVHELVADVHWQRPNDVKVQVRGARSRSVRLPGVSARDVAGFWTEIFASEPWFAARYLGNEIQMIGVPDVPARHPLAPDGEQWYRYAITDSASLLYRNRTVRVIGVEVRPRGPAPFPLLTGQVWLERDSLSVVRLTGAIAGPGLWEDDDDESPVLVDLEIDLEYALHDESWWLPHRQIVTTHWSYRFLPGATMTGISATSFADHRIMPDSSIAFASSGTRRGGQWSVWACDFAGGYEQCGRRGLLMGERRDGGRWEVVIPPLDDILAYPFDSALAYHDDLLDEAALSERLIAMSTWSSQVPGRNFSLTASDLSLFQVLGFERVRGGSLGGGVSMPLHGLWSMRVVGRVALHEPFWTGDAGFRREDPSGRLEIKATRQLASVEPWTPDGGLGPALRGIFLGHDDADWYLVEGGSMSWRGYRGSTRGFQLSAAVERHQSVTTQSGTFLYGAFQPNPDVTEGWMTRMTVSRRGEVGEIGADLLAGEHGAGTRVWARGAYRSLRVLAATQMGDGTPQHRFRIGGPWTVRGLPYGVVQGRHLWAMQLDQPLRAGPFVLVIPFVDVAGTFGRNDPNVGVGLGVSDNAGLLRLDLAVGLRPEVTTRIDLRVTLQ